MKQTLMFGALLLAAGCGFTKMTHPDVEVFDPDSKKFLMEEVSPLSKCGSCHDNLTDKYVVYNKAVKNKTSLDKLNLMRSDAFTGAEMRGYDNYAETELGFYYFYPWWYDNYVVNSGLYHRALVADNDDITDARRRRHSYRRGSGRLRLSSPTTPAATASSPMPAALPSVPASAATANPNATTNSNSGDDGNNRRRSTERNATSEPSRRQSEGNAPPDKRESGRSR